MWIAWDLSVHSDVGEVTYDTMGVAVYYGVSVLILSLGATALLGGSFGFRRCGIFNLLLMLKFFAVDCCHRFVHFGSGFLVF